MGRQFVYIRILILIIKLKSGIKCELVKINTRVVFQCGPKLETS